MAKTKRITNVNDKSIPNVIKGWDQVLEDTEKGQAEAKARVRGLGRAIKMIRANIQAGKPFPSRRDQPTNA